MFESYEVAEKFLEEFNQHKMPAEVFLQFPWARTKEMVWVVPKLHDHIMNVLKNKVYLKTWRPLAEDSGKTIMNPYTLPLQHKFNLQPGEYLLADGYKTKEIASHYFKRKATIEEIFNEYQKLTGNDTDVAEFLSEEEFGKIDSQLAQSLYDLHKDLQHVAIRVPADSPGGIRVLNLKGFTGTKGYGAVYHPEDMWYMGGADLDIDSAFLFFNLHL